jgi:hypothetical protein
MATRGTKQRRIKDALVATYPNNLNRPSVWQRINRMRIELQNESRDENHDKNRQEDRVESEIMGQDVT